MDVDGDVDDGRWTERQREEEKVMVEGSRFYQVAVYDRQTSQRSLRGVGASSTTALCRISCLTSC